MKTKARSMTVAVLLSIPLPGLGQLYCGRHWAALGFVLLHFSGWGVFFATFVGGGWELQSASRAALAVFGLALVGAGIHAAWAARKAGDGYGLKAYNLWYFYLLVWLLAGMGPTFGIFQVVRSELVTTLPLMSDAMHPSLLMGDRLRLDRRQATRESLQPGDVVALIDPLDKQTLRVLRLVAREGQQVKLGPEGLTVDGEHLLSGEGEAYEYDRRRGDGQWRTVKCRLQEEKQGARNWRICRAPDPKMHKAMELKVPAGQVFVLGDNRMRAKDSREFGPLPKDLLQGRIFQVRYSIDAQSKSLRKERKGLNLK